MEYIETCVANIYQNGDFYQPHELDIAAENKPALEERTRSTARRTTLTSESAQHVPSHSFIACSARFGF